MFDGGGYVVRNISITDIPANNTSSEGVFIGMFGYAENAVFKNVYLDNISVIILDSKTNSDVYVGSVCGKTEGQVIFEQCGTNGKIDLKMSKAKIITGGIVGEVSASNSGLRIENSFSDMDITASSSRRIFAGGIAGNIEINGSDSFFEINKVYYSGDLSVNTSGSSYAFAGGIVAYAIYEPDWDDVSYYAVLEKARLLNSTYNITNSFVNCTIDISSANLYVGQICGYADGVKSANVYCSSEQTGGNTGYAIRGIPISVSSFTDVTFISETLTFDTGNIWLCQNDRLTLRKADINNIYAVYSEGVVTVNGTVNGASSDIVIIAIKNKNGRLLATGITSCGLLNNYNVSCADSPYMVQIIVLNTEALFKPKSDDLHIFM